MVYSAGRLRSLLAVLSEERYRCFLHADDKKTFSWYSRQRGKVVCYHRFGTACMSQKIVWTLKMGPIGCPETSLTNDQSTLRRHHLHRGGSLQSRKKMVSYWASNWKMMEQIRMYALRKRHFAFLETRHRVREPVILWTFLLAKFQKCGPFDYPETVRLKHNVTTFPIFN